jgi:hypothetical protein
MTNKFFSIIALFFLLGACGNEPKVSDAAPAKIPDNLGGYWVSDAWWQELQSTKSPKKAAEKLGDVAGPFSARTTQHGWPT